MSTKGGEDNNKLGPAGERLLRYLIEKDKKEIRKRLRKRMREERARKVIPFRKRRP